MAPSSSKSPPPPHPHAFTPIQECEREEQEDGTPSAAGTEKGLTPTAHIPTPLHETHGKSKTKRRHQSGDEPDHSVSCNKCRPNSREKISVVPVDNNGGGNKSSPSLASPNGILKSIFGSLTRKSPRAVEISPAREEQWKIALAELSHKLIQATRMRDEAVLEASRLKHSMEELEKKLSKLEIYCHNLKSGLDECSGNSNSPFNLIAGRVQNTNIQVKNHPNQGGLSGVNERLIEQFLISVSEARSSVRFLSRSLTMQLRQMGGKVYERIALLLQPYDIKISSSRNPKSMLFYMEALLNRAFFEDFESAGFQKNWASQILNPADRCETSYAAFNDLLGLTWEEVLNKGTRHFSEEFSRFCDRKMSEIVAMLGWNRAWPEPLLQAFFGASKSVWLVHLLANSVHPSLTIFRVDKSVRFDSVYMEDMGGESVKKMVPAIVRIMVAPGFYVFGNVVKSKVLCRYYNHSIDHCDAVDNKQ